MNTSSTYVQISKSDRITSLLNNSHPEIKTLALQLFLDNWTPWEDIKYVLLGEDTVPLRDKPRSSLDPETYILLTALRSQLLEHNSAIRRVREALWCYDGEFSRLFSKVAYLSSSKVDREPNNWIYAKLTQILTQHGEDPSVGVAAHYGYSKPGFRLTRYESLVKHKDYFCRVIKRVLEEHTKHAS